jgi:hypothetical protein
LKVGSLTIEMAANVARLQKDMDSARRSVDGAMSQISRSVSGAKAMLGSLGLGLSIGGFAAWIKSTIDAADALGDLSQRTGIAAMDLVGLEAVAKSSGTSLESLTSAVRILAKNQLEAKTGNKEISSILQALGATSDDAMQSLIGMADVVAAMPDGMQKMAIMQKALGKSAAELIPIFNQGSDALRQQIEWAQKYSGFTQEMIDASDQFNDTMEQVALLTRGFAVAIAKDVLPILVQLAQYLVASGESAKNGAQGFSLLRVVLQTIIIFASDVAFVLRMVGAEIGGIAAQIAALMKLDFKAFSFIGEQMKSDAAAARKALDEFQKNILNPPAISLPSVKFKPKGGDVDWSALINESSKKKFWEFFSGEEVQSDKLSRYQNLANFGYVISDKRAEKMIRQMHTFFDEVGREEAEARQRLLEGDDVLKAMTLARDAQTAIRTRLFHEVALGIKTEAQAQQELVLASQTLGESLAGTLIPRLEELIAAAPNDETREKWRALIAEISALQNTLSQTTAFEGLTAAVREYGNSAGDVFTNMKGVASNALKGIEDAFVTLALTGKLSFKSLADSIVADLTRMIVRQQMYNILAPAGLMNPSAAGGGNILDSIGKKLFGFADGGVMTSAGPLPLQAYSTGGVAAAPQLALFGEGRRPEAYVPLPDGRTIPVTMKGPSGMTQNITVNVTTPTGSLSRESMQQMQTAIGAATQRALRRNS